jgi:hypothetical protein
VRVINLSSDGAKAGLAGGAGVATLGAWLLEAATAGKAKFAADVLATLDGLPIGMKALRSAGIGKTVSAPHTHSRDCCKLQVAVQPTDLKSTSAAKVPCMIHEAVVAAPGSLCMQLGYAEVQLPTMFFAFLPKERILPSGPFFMAALGGIHAGAHHE